MRRMLIERWHHFGYLVISLALLGFGASGTLLAALGRRVRAAPGAVLFWSAAGFTMTLILVPRLMGRLPVTAHFLPSELPGQAGWWSVYWLAGLLPFLCGAALLGAALMTAGPHVGRVYAANLLGGASGAVGAALLLSRLPVRHGLWPCSAMALFALALLGCRSGRGRWVLTSSALVGLAVGTELGWPLDPRYDQFKYGAWIEQLVAQGSARRVACRADPRGQVELYESDLFHDLPFLAPAIRPPPVYSVVINGDAAGSMLRISRLDQAEVMDHTLMAFPYRLIPPRPAVLLIGEVGGTNAWLARRMNAGRVDIVQPNSAVLNLLAEHSPGLLEAPEIHCSTQSPRRFLRSTARPGYDLIQIVSLEGLGLGVPGLRGLAEDHLATVEAFAECLTRLSEGGVLAVSRGIEQPPRANVRLLATMAEALESLGVSDPAGHIVQVRDYLGVCTIAMRSPLTPARRQTLQRAVAELNLTPVWYDGLPIEQVNRPDRLDGPPGSPVDWLHYAADEIFSPRREGFYRAWLMNVRPARDDRPFFWDFYKPQAIVALKRAYGPLWLTRVELGRLFLYASLVAAAVTSIVVILLPLSIFGRRCRPTVRQPTRRLAWAAPTLYFAGIGVGFMSVEMALISRTTGWLGDPVVSSAVVIGGLLLASGLGSLSSTGWQRLTTGVGGHRPIWLAPAIIATGIGTLLLAGWKVELGKVQVPAALLVACPLGFLMGLPMPTAIADLSARMPRMVAWAWGINGVASVAATSGSLALAMIAGYRAVILLAAAAYGLAALAAARPNPAGQG